MAEVEFYQNILVFLLNLFGVFLLGVVWFSDSERTIKRIFSGLSLSMFTWVNFAHFARIIDNPDLTMLFLRIAWFITPIFFLLIYYFSLSTSPRRHKYNQLTVIVTFLGIISGFAAGFGDLVLRGFQISRNGALQILYGGGMYPFLIAVAIMIFATIFVLIKTYVKANSITKKQLIIYFYGLAVFYILNIVFNITLPIFFGITRYYYFGDYSTIILLAFLALSISFYKFLDIGFIIGKVIYLLLLSLIPIGFSIVLYRVAIVFLGSDPLLPLALTSPIIGAVFILTYQFFDRFFNEEINVRFINPGYDAIDESEMISKDLSQVTTLNEIFSILKTSVSRTIKPNFVLIAAKLKENNKLYFSESNVLDEKDVEFLLSFLEGMEKKELIYDKIKLDPMKKSIADFMNNLALRYVTYLSGENFKGVLVLGKKEADSLYKVNDLRLLNTLDQLSEAALNRSFLFEEVKQFNKTLQQKVDEATTELELRNEQLGEQLRKERDMMDILGHELRTPLGTARNALVMIDTMETSGNIDQEKYEKYFRIAIRNIKREKDLLETILQSARLENNRIQINLEKVAIADVIEDTMTAFKDQAEEKGLKLTSEVKDNAYVHVDRTAIQQIVDNLVSNAVKYTYEGFVKVIVSSEGEDHIRVSVEDSGEGLRDEDIAKLGKKFFRANTHLDSEGKIGDRKIVRPGGTGIGLYVIKGLLKEFGSELEVDSEFGKGSTFSFKLKKLDLEELSKKGEIEGKSEEEAFEEARKK